MSEWPPAKRQALLWLGNKIGINPGFELKGLIKQIESRGSIWHYKKLYMKKSDGTIRTIWQPDTDLQYVQKRIGRMLQRDFPRHPNSYGFSGGSGAEMAERHKNSTWICMWDLRDAFEKVHIHRVIEALREKYGYWVSMMIADLCFLSWEGPRRSREHMFFTMKEGDWFPTMNFEHQYYYPMHYFLPQGAPTSPKLFDISMLPLDRQFAGRTEEGEIITRYADNFYFSSEHPKWKMCTRFRNKLKEAGFDSHKFAYRKLSDSVPILGYTLEPGQVKNRKKQKKRLKNAIHILERCLELGQIDTQAIATVRGHLGFIKGGIIPEELKTRALKALEAANA